MPISPLYSLSSGPLVARGEHAAARQSTNLILTAVISTLSIGLFVAARKWMPHPASAFVQGAAITFATIYLPLTIAAFGKSYALYKGNYKPEHNYNEERWSLFQIIETSPTRPLASQSANLALSLFALCATAVPLAMSLIGRIHLATQWQAALATASAISSIASLTHLFRLGQASAYQKAVSHPPIIPSTPSPSLPLAVHPKTDSPDFLDVCSHIPPPTSLGEILRTFKDSPAARKELLKQVLALHPEYTKHPEKFGALADAMEETLFFTLDYVKPFIEAAIELQGFFKTPEEAQRKKARFERFIRKINLIVEGKDPLFEFGLYLISEELIAKFCLKQLGIHIQEVAPSSSQKEEFKPITFLQLLAKPSLPNLIAYLASDWKAARKLLKTGSKLQGLIKPQIKDSIHTELKELIICSAYVKQPSAGSPTSPVEGCYKECTETTPPPSLNESEKAALNESEKTAWREIQLYNNFLDHISKIKNPFSVIEQCKKVKEWLNNDKVLKGIRSKTPLYEQLEKLKSRPDFIFNSFTKIITELEKFSEVQERIQKAETLSDTLTEAFLAALPHLAPSLIDLLEHKYKIIPAHLMSILSHAKENATSQLASSTSEHASNASPHPFIYLSTADKQEVIRVAQAVLNDGSLLREILTLFYSVGYAHQPSMGSDER